MERKGLRVNARKIKFMVCGTGIDLLQSLGEFPCAICRTGVCRQQQYLMQWIHALGAQEVQWAHAPLRGPKLQVLYCQGTARHIDGRPQEELQVVSEKREVLVSFFYLGDMLSVAGGYDLSTNKYVKTAWKKSKELLPVLSSSHLSYNARGRVYSL